MSRHHSNQWSGRSTGQPIRLADVVDERLRDLSPQARKVLEILAVSGRPIGADEACRAAGVTENGSSVLAMLRSARLIRPTRVQMSHDRYETYHDRIRETILSSLDAGTLQAHHLSLARTLDALSYPDPEVLAIHYREAGVLPKASRYFALAGDQAIGVLAFDRASSLYRLAIELGAATARNRGTSASDWVRPWQTLGEAARPLESFSSRPSMTRPGHWTCAVARRFST